MGGVGGLGDTSVFGVFFVDGLSSEKVVDELGEQQDHGDDGQDERDVVQGLVADGVIGVNKGTGLVKSNGGTVSVVDIVELIDGGGDAQTNDEDEDDVEENGVLSLGGQEEFQKDPNDHQAGAGVEKTSGGAAPAASDDSFQSGDDGVDEEGFTGDGGGLLVVDGGDLLDGTVVGALVRAIRCCVVVEFIPRETELVVAGVLGSDTGEDEQDNCDDESEKSERLSAAETHD